MAENQTALVEPPITAPAGSDFAPLLRLIRDRGLLTRRTDHYAAAIGLNLALLAAVWAALALVGNTWWQLLLAVPAAILTARTAFFGHDAGHQQIAGTRRANRVLGLIHGNLLTGMSHGWWTEKHNKHHANPNHVEKDPDVGVGALVWTTDQASERRGWTRWVSRHQAALFFPMLLLEGINLKISGIRDLRNRPAQDAAVEAALLTVHFIGYAAVLLTVLTPGKALVFALLHQAVLGLHLGCAFAPNHKGMPMPGPGERWGHLRRQVLTSRNVRGGVVTDWMLGGLNYQIEHHLFPSMPRPHLRLAQPVVREYCAELGVPYAETGLVESYAQALSHLHTVGAPLR